MDMTTLLPLFLASLVLALKPGPNMLAYTTMSLDGRLKALLSFWAGSCIAGGIMYLFLLTGLSLIPESFGMVFLFLKATAAVLFVNFGFMGLKNKLGEDQQAGQARAKTLEGQSIIKNMISGFVLVLSNPYVIVFILTAVPALVDQMSFTLIDVIVIYAVVMGADILMVSAYCAPLFFIRRALSEKVLKGISVVASCAMIIIGVLVLISMFTLGDLREAGLLAPSYN